MYPSQFSGIDLLRSCHPNGTAFLLNAGNSSEPSAAGLEECIPHFPEEYMQTGRGASSNPMCHHSGNLLNGVHECLLFRIWGVVPAIVSRQGRALEIESTQVSCLSLRQNASSGKDAPYPLPRKEGAHRTDLQLHTGQQSYHVRLFLCERRSFHVLMLSCIETDARRLSNNMSDVWIPVCASRRHNRGEETSENCRRLQRSVITPGQNHFCRLRTRLQSIA